MATAGWAQDEHQGLPDSILYFEPVAMMTSGASAHEGEGGAAADGMELSFSTLGRDFDLDLELHDPFAAGAKVRWVDDTGVVEEPADDGSHFRGHVKGDPGSWVRLTLRGNALTGIVATGDEMYFLEPSARFFRSAPRHETIAFRLSDIDATAIQAGCGTSHRMAHRRRGTKLTRRDLRAMFDAVGGVAAAAVPKQADIGLIADFEFFSKPAHNTDTAVDLAEILNEVDGIYQSELGVTVQVAGTTVFTTANDPFSAGTINQLLDQVRNWRGANLGPGQPMFGTDLAHLFTGRNLDGNVIGIAYTGVLCSSTHGAGVDEDWTNPYSASLMSLLMAHEMGHNFGAPHDHQAGSDCVAEPGTFIMNPSLSANLQRKFSPCSKSEIAPVVATAAAAGCLNPTLTPPTAVPTPTPTTAALAAQFVSQSVPSSMTAGQQYSVSVTMRNSGATTWTAASLVGLGAVNPYDNAIWGMNRAGLAGSDTIGPGQQKTFTWTVRAPAIAGNYNFQWRMVRDGVAWFGDTSANTVVAVSAAGLPDASFVSQSVPTAMTAGQQYSVSVTMRNTGATTWTAAGFYRLGAVNPYNNALWGMNRVGLTSGESVAPNQNKTFTWTVTAPASAGTYNFQWRMVRDGVMWFGPTTVNAVVTVSGGGTPNAAYVSHSVPTSMTAGQQYSVSVTMRNSGGTTWTPGAWYRLGAINPYDNAIWGMNRVGLSSGESVAVGQQKTFTWTVRAPTTPGQYNFQWRMVRDGVMWFGDSSANVVVSVQ